METNIIYNEECLSGLKKLPDNSINCCVTSPPYYGLRDYGTPEQIGLEETPEEYIQKLTDVFGEIRRTMTDDGTLWVNISDCYAGSMKGAAGYPENAMNYKQGTNRGTLGKATLVKQCVDCKPKDLIGIPWMLAFSLRSDGWYWRDTIIWSKPSCMPESVKDRTTKSHEYILLFSKSKKYYFDCDAIAENISDSTINKVARGAKLPVFGGDKYNNEEVFFRTKSGLPYNVKETRHKRSVWSVATQPLREAHFATYPEKLIVDCIKAGCPENGIVLDPFMGSGTTAIVARKLNRNYVGFEMNAKYMKIAKKRIEKELGLFR